MSLRPVAHLKMSVLLNETAICAALLSLQRRGHGDNVKSNLLLSDVYVHFILFVPHIRPEPDQLN